MNRIFEGYAQTKPFSREVIIVNENRSATILKPDRSQAVKNHSPDGFNWGYGGSGACAARTRDLARGHQRRRNSLTLLPRLRAIGHRRDPVPRNQLEDQRKQDHSVA